MLVAGLIAVGIIVTIYGLIPRVFCVGNTVFFISTLPLPMSVASYFGNNEDDVYDVLVVGWKTFSKPPKKCQICWRWNGRVIRNVKF